MKLALCALGVLAAGYVLYRHIAIGPKNAPTLAEERIAAFGHLAPKYRYTQKQQWWKLQLRRGQRKRTA